MPRPIVRFLNTSLPATTSAYSMLLVSDAKHCSWKPTGSHVDPSSSVSRPATYAGSARAPRASL